MIENKSVTIGIDASRNRSGGAIGHIVGLLSGASPLDFGITRVHLWAHDSLMEVVPDYPWLVKHHPPVLQKSILSQLWWQFYQLPSEANRLGCDVLFNSDAGSVNPFQPSVTLSQDMLSFEPGEMKRYGASIARIRLLILRWIQKASLIRADGAVFLTSYAAKIIQRQIGDHPNAVVIPHGVDEDFRQLPTRDNLNIGTSKELIVLYVSNTAPYKHQWHVVRAIELLRLEGYRLKLRLVGGGKGPAQVRLAKQIAVSDPAAAFVELYPFEGRERLLQHHSEADIFLFASSCENMPITLLEAMAVGVPIACSDRGPMSEVLEDAGVYFDPEEPCSIIEAIAKIMESPVDSALLAQQAHELALQYSWNRCSRETWQFLVKCVERRTKR